MALGRTIWKSAKRAAIAAGTIAVVRRLTGRRRSAFASAWVWAAIGTGLSAAGATAFAIMKSRAKAAVKDARDSVDEASWESFPASDAPSFSPGTT